MPWNEPGKGSGGNNGQDPWKGGGGQQPPDLDEVFSNVQKRLKQIIGNDGSNKQTSGNSGGSGLGGVLTLAALLAGIWILWNSIHIIDEPERGVVLRFGEYVRTLQPGLNFTFPAPIELVEKVDVSEVRSIENRSRMLTGDENLIELGFAVQYQVVEPEKFLFNVVLPEQSLSEAADSSIREVVGTNNMDFILEAGRQEIAINARTLLQEIVDRYDSGIVLTEFALQEIRPPTQVQDAFDDVVRAREDQLRFANQAQAYANQVVPEARGQAARVLEEAQAYRDSVIAQADGESDRFVAIYREYAEAPEVTRQRLYLQALEELYSTVPKVLLDTQSGNNLLYLPLDRLGAGGAQPGSPPPPPMFSQDTPNTGNNANSGRQRTGREGR
ncbi:MAG: FtsH protease activity modulator HflK [Pseudomonadota bacterium]